MRMCVFVLIVSYRECVLYYYPETTIMKFQSRLSFIENVLNQSISN